MPYWQRIYDYFLDIGFPEGLLDFVCVHSNEAAQIIDIIEQKNPDSILEIGTFIGLSTGVIALTSAPTSTLVAVDPNLPVEILSKKFHLCESREAFWFVRSMLEHFGLCQKVVLFEGYFSCLSSSYRDRFVALGGDPAIIDGKKVDIIGEKVRRFAPYDLVFIDADHSAESVYSDLSLVHCSLSEDGVIALHDLDVRGSWGRHVRAGIATFLQEHPEFSISINENLGFLCRKAFCGSTF